ncbi:E3 ubiquitin/ISG15 ligase TRIM25-like [Leptodactylus fuscus]|uniref:E3 ubiquitin/ISG15 ligase TRIM25-like n=1 Tax=Leptodactylus fuscus TaxID=238119 RepID=UPI003F4EC51A
MASADLRDELNCSICLSLYTDPVFLRCGHNFCSPCIVSVLDTQEAAGAYFCPDCRAEYPERPALEKNRKLGNIVECFLSTLPDIEKTKTICPDCTKTPVSAMKSHLHCEISLCHEHLEAHNKLVDESLVEPTESFESRKCSKHNEILKYYCPIDAACICESCCVDGDHKGHDVDRLDVASEKKKEKLRSDIDKLNSKKEEAGKRIQNLQDHGKEQQEKAAGLAKRVSGLFIDLREKMDNLEKRIQDDISKQKYQVSLTVLTSVLQMQQHKDELTKIVSQLEEMCNISDPFTLLQEDLYSDDISDKSCDVISDVRDAQCLDEVIISHTLQKGLLNFSDYMINLKKREFTVTENSDLLLDIDSAHNNIMISQNLRSASYTATLQNRPDGPKNLKPVQVLSSQWAESIALPMMESLPQQDPSYPPQIASQPVVQYVPTGPPPMAYQMPYQGPLGPPQPSQPRRRKQDFFSCWQCGQMGHFRRNCRSGPTRGREPRFGNPSRDNFNQCPQEHLDVFQPHPTQ